MEVDESKHSPVHLTSPFSGIPNAGRVKKSPSKRKRLRRDSSTCREKVKNEKSKKANVDSSANSSTRIVERSQRDWDNLNRVKPDVLDREFERSLARIATKGVVQLFNAIREHQSRVDEAVGQSGTTTVKVERVVKSISRKEKFLDLVSKSTTKGKAKRRSESSVGNGELASSESKAKIIKQEDDHETTKKWDVLRDDFLLHSGKDWDKEDD